MKKGKIICEHLKQIRLDIARENGIDYTPNECHHEGDCAGTCPACDNELRYLEQAINRKRSLGKAAIVGISMSMASLSLTSCVGMITESHRGAYEDEETSEMVDTAKSESMIISNSSTVNDYETVEAKGKGQD